MRLHTSADFVWHTLFCILTTLCNFSAKYGAAKADELLRSKDAEFHGVLEWAADAGDLNSMEWLLRKGLSPLEHDDRGRGPLYWAAKSHQPDAVRVLVFACGCDPHAADAKDGDTPYKIALRSGDVELINAFRRSDSLCSIFWRPCVARTSTKTLSDKVLIPVEIRKGTKGIASRLSHESAEERRSSQGVLLSSGGSVRDLESGEVLSADSELYVGSLYRDARGYERCLSTPPKNISELKNAVIYGVFVLAVWMLAVVMPFWIWSAFAAAVGYLYRSCFSSKCTSSQVLTRSHVNL